MPQITVEYSDALADHFDRRAFALALHPITAKTIGTTVDACKTRFRRLDDAVLADGSPAVSAVHIEMAILSGRTPEAKHELGRAVLGLLSEYVVPIPGGTLLTSLEIRDMDRDHYYKRP